MHEEKYFAPLRILYLFIKSFVNRFVDISLTFSDSSFNSFSTNTCFDLFEVTFIFRFISLSSTSVFLTRLAISLLDKFAYFNLALILVGIALIFLTNSLYSVFVATSFFTTSLSLLQSTRVVPDLPKCNLSISDFNLAKSALLGNSDVSKPVAFFKSTIVAKLDKSNSPFTFSPKVFV